MATLKKSTFLIMLFSIVTRIISFFFKIYLSRRVGAEVLGLFQMAISVFGLFCTIAASGVPLMLSRKTAELTALKNREEELHGVMTGATILSLAVTLFLIFGCILFRKKLRFVFSDGRCADLFFILLPCLISTVMYQLLRGYFMGKGRYFDYSVTELLEEIIKVVSCLSFLSSAFIALSESVAIAVAFLVTDYAIMTILLILYFIKGGRFRKPRGVKMLIRSGLPVTGMRVAAGLISSFIAIALPSALMKGGLSAGEAAAEYGRAVGMAFSLLFAPLALTSALSVVILPEAASLAATGRWEDLRVRVNNSLLFIFIITVLFYALFLILGECYGELLFKDVKAGRFISFSAGMVIPAALSGLLNTTLNSLGEERKVFLSFLISALFLVLSVLILPRFIGIYALSVGECGFHLINFVFGMVFLWKKRAYDGRIFRPAAITMALSFPTALLVKLSYLPLSKWGSGVFLRAAFPTLVGILVYAGLLLVFRPIPDLKAVLLRHNKKRAPSHGSKKKLVTRQNHSETELPIL